MRPREMGRAILLGTTIIPAVNIQVENVPGYIDMGDRTEWYGVYFEILFETGCLWVISQGSEEPKKGQGYNPWIVVMEYPKWAFTESRQDLGNQHYLSSWRSFLGLYNEMREALEWGC